LQFSRALLAICASVDNQKLAARNLRWPEGGDRHVYYAGEATAREDLAMDMVTGDYTPSFME